MNEMNDTKYITARIAYTKYGLARSLIRTLSDQGRVRMEERDTGGDNVLKMYNEADIIRFINGK